MKKTVVCILLLLFISIKVINAEIIEFDGEESPIRKYFNIQKIIWTFDDYYFHLNHHPPHKGFDGLSSQINNFSGHVNIMTVFTTPNATKPYGNEIRNYSVVNEFNWSQNMINKSLVFFERNKIYPACHGWNHSADLNGANMSFSHKLIYHTLWNWINNYNITPHFFVGHDLHGNYNITVALKHFSEDYWNMFGEHFKYYNCSMFPNCSSSDPAVEYIGKYFPGRVTMFDPLFGCKWGNPCKTLEEAMERYNTSTMDKEIIFIRGHPGFLNSSHQRATENLSLWQDWIDWIYEEHDLININHTQVIYYNIDRYNFCVIKNNDNNYTIDLSNCSYSHNLLFSNPSNDISQWTLYDSNSTKISNVCNDTFIELDPMKYYLIKEKNNIVLFNLSKKWNLIGLSIDNSVAKENLTVQYNGTSYTWQEAVNNSIVLGSIYNWDAASQNYKLADVLYPSLGYWMYAYYDCRLLRLEN